MRRKVGRLGMHDDVGVAGRELLHDCLSVHANPLLHLELLPVKGHRIELARLFASGSDQNTPEIVNRRGALKLLINVHSSSTTSNCGESTPSPRCRPSASRLTRSTLP